MAYTELRGSLISRLSSRSDTAPGDERFYHGRLISERLEVPEVTWGSTASPSEDMRECPSWLTAAEFSDRPASLEVKLTALLDLLRSSRHTVIFAGAGVSTSAGVRQRARADPSRTVRDQKRTEAVPTITHLTLTSLLKVSSSPISLTIIISVISSTTLPRRWYTSTPTVSCRRPAVPRRKSMRCTAPGSIPPTLL